MTNLLEVRNYWQEHPLHSYELGELGTLEFFDNLHRIKSQDIEKFALPFLAFNSFAGKKVLDAGCGPGWFTVQYALGEAEVTAIDLTPRAVELTRRHLAFKRLTAEVREANVEKMPFEDETFDLIVSLGVLHHTPKTALAFHECFRVLKRDGTAKFALYHKGILHQPLIFKLMQRLMRLLGVRHPGADLSRTAGDVDEFIRQYDGIHNPVGIGKTTREWKKALQQAGFKIKRHELHYFPRRFIPCQRWIPDFIHKILDRMFGTLVYFDLVKPNRR